MRVARCWLFCSTCKTLLFLSVCATYEGEGVRGAVLQLFREDVLVLAYMVNINLNVVLSRRVVAAELVAGA